MKYFGMFILSLMIIFMFSCCQEQSEEQPTLVVKESTRHVLLREVFTDCEHSRDLNTETRSSLESEKDLKEAYPGFFIVSLEGENATLARYQKGKCAEHYLFKEYRGKIGVFRENNGALLDVLDVSVRQLRLQDREVLKDGVSVFGKEECAAFWDDFGS